MSGDWSHKVARVINSQDANGFVVRSGSFVDSLKWQLSLFFVTSLSLLLVLLFVLVLVVLLFIFLILFLFFVLFLVVLL